MQPAFINILYIYANIYMPTDIYIYRPTDIYIYRLTFICQLTFIYTD